MPTTKDFKLEELSQYFHLPEKAVAKELGICLTSLKKLCRSYGITRWPFRKLKSIQRTLAKVQDESSAPGVSAQLSAAGLMLECGEGSSNGAAADAEGKDVPANARPQELAPAAGGAGGAGAAGGGGGSRSAVAKKRKPYQLGGRTLLLTEEEKSIYELTIGKQGGGAGAGELRPLQGVGAAAAAAPVARAGSTPSGSDGAPGTPWLQAEARQAPSPPNSSAFSCSSVGATLQIKNWATLWTQEHLQKRLLEPLGGTSISLVPQSNLATLHFESEKTAQRAELICRAAAAAAEKNLKLQSQAGSLSSRAQSPSLSQGLTPAESPGGGSNASEDGRSSALQLLMPSSIRGSNSDGSGNSHLGSGSSGAQGKVKLEIPPPGAQANPNIGSHGSATSPMFKSTPTTPPTSFTNYLFEPASQYDGAFGALMLNPTSGLQFDDPGGGVVEVPSGSIMNGGGPDDMTVALMAGGTMSGSQLADSVDQDLFIAVSPPNTAGSGEGPGGGDGKVDSNGDGSSAASILLGGPTTAQVLLSGQTGSNGSVPTSPLLPPSTSPLLPPSATSPLLPPSSTSPLLPPSSTSPLLPPASSPLLPASDGSSALLPPSTGDSVTPLLPPSTQSPLLVPASHMVTPPASSAGAEAAAAPEQPPPPQSAQPPEASEPAPTAEEATGEEATGEGGGVEEEGAPPAEEAATAAPAPDDAQAAPAAETRETLPEASAAAEGPEGGDAKAVDAAAATSGAAATSEAAAKAGEAAAEPAAKPEAGE